MNMSHLSKHRNQSLVVRQPQNLGSAVVDEATSPSFSGVGEGLVASSTTPKPKLDTPLALAAFVLLAIISSAGCGRQLAPLELLERGVLLAQREHFAESLKNFNQSLALEAENPDTYYERAVVYERLDQPELALADYSEAVRLDPEFGLAYHNRAILLQSLGQHQAAIEDCSRIVKIDASVAEVYQLRCEAHRDLGQMDQALADIRMAIELDPSAQAYVVEGNLLSSLGQFAEAVTSFDEAIAMDARLSRAWLGRGIAMAGQSHTVVARQNLEHAAQIDADILVDDLLAAFNEMDVPIPAPQLSLEQAKAELSRLGWKYTPTNDDVFPLQISQPSDDQPSDDQPRLLCVATLARGQQCVSFPGNHFVRILHEQGPKSLLVATSTDDGGTQWRFTSEWQPTGDHMQTVTVAVPTQMDRGRKLAQASR